jgi:hypothetical protein
MVSFVSLLGIGLEEGEKVRDTYVVSGGQSAVWATNFAAGVLETLKCLL